MIKVLWITFWGTWTKPLINLLKKECEIEVIIPSEGKEDYRTEFIDGVKYHYVIFPKGKGVFVNMSESIYSRYRFIIDSFKPQIIHVHGTEKNLAQIQNYVKHIPVVISIQGLLSGCLKYNLAFLSKRELFMHTSLKNIIGHGGLDLAERICKRGVENYEKDILNNGKYFIGRTLWDRAHIHMTNPKSNYYVGEEILRPLFYKFQGQWSVDKCERHTIMMPSGYNPLKGMHFAIQAVAHIKKFYPDVVLKIPGIPRNFRDRKGLRKIIIGEEFIEYCKTLINENDLESNIRFLPYLHEEDMLQEMLKSNVFLSCSTIDNSSNAIGESTMLGVPLVATSVGGVLSILDNEKTALMVPSGDFHVMAYQIKRLFDSDDLCNQLSSNEICLAQKRHNPMTTTSQYINIYKGIIKKHNNNE